MRSIRKYITLSMGLFFLLGLSAQAELRTWTDSRGHTIEAELLENMHGNITLQTESGKEVHIDISDLSADDQKYVLVNSPPKIDIKVSKVTDRQNKGFTFEDAEDSSNDRDYQVQTSSTHYKVSLKKRGTIPYTKPITAELYVIGYKKQSDEFIVLSKTVRNVDFSQDEDGKEFEFTSANTTTRNLQGGKKAGTVYHGNLVVLVDENNRVFDAKGSRSKMQEHAAFIRKLDEGFTIAKTDVASAINESKKAD